MTIKRLLPAAMLLFAVTSACAVYSGFAGAGASLPGTGFFAPTGPLGFFSPEPQADSITLLILGLDGDEKLTDVVMLGRLDNRLGSAVLLQLPRDLYVGEAGGVSGKLNGVYGHGGVLAVKRVLREQMGLIPDYCVVVDMATVRDAVDDLGGITVDLPQQINYLPGKSLPPGKQTLSGEEAEWLIRTRNIYSDGDLGRMRAQLIFLSGVMEAAKAKGFAGLGALALKYHSRLSTDMPLDVLLSELPVAMRLGGEDIETVVMPLYKFAMYGEYSVFVTNRRKLALLLEEHFGVNPNNVATSWGPPEPEPDDDTDDEQDERQRPWDGIFEAPDWAALGT